jgi:hypothetical protein
MVNERLIRQAEIKNSVASDHGVDTLIALYRFMATTGLQQDAEKLENALCTFVWAERIGQPRPYV